jgi:hypothetical protein
LEVVALHHQTVQLLVKTLSFLACRRQPLAEGLAHKTHLLEMADPAEEETGLTADEVAALV